MSVNHTAKITISTTKGNVEIGLYAKEVPMVKDFLMSCKSLQDQKLLYQEDLVRCDFVVPHYKPFRHNRLRVIKGTVGLTGDELVINLNPDITINMTIIGEIIGNSIYNLVKIKELEFDTFVKQVSIDVPYFDLPTDQSTAVTDAVPEHTKAPEPKKRKRKVNLNYDYEDDGFKMKSIYDVKKLKVGVANSAQEPAQEPAPVQPVRETVPEQPVKQTEPVRETSTAQQPLEQAPLEEPAQILPRPLESKPEKLSSAAQSPDTPRSAAVYPPKPASRPTQPQPAAQAKPASYQDIPMSILRNHKYILPTTRH